jgi:transposase
MNNRGSTPEEFVNVYMQAYRNGHNAVWVAQQLGIHRQSVYDRMEKLRARGVKLPKLPRFDKQQDKRLKALIAEQLGGRARGSTDAAA